MDDNAKSFVSINDAMDETVEKPNKDFRMSFVVHHSPHSQENELLCCWRFYFLSTTFSLSVYNIGTDDDGTL